MKYRVFIPCGQRNVVTTSVCQSSKISRGKRRRKYLNRLETIKMVVWSSITRAVARPNPFVLLSKPKVSPTISKNGKSFSFCCFHNFTALNARHGLRAARLLAVSLLCNRSFVNNNRKCSFICSIFIGNSTSTAPYVRPWTASHAHHSFSLSMA